MTKGNDVDYLMGQLNDQLKQLIDNLGITIIIDPSLSTYGQYNMLTNTITLQSLSTAALHDELVHALQDKLGILNTGSRANNEFQEHIIGDLLRAAGMLTGGGLVGSSTVSLSDYEAYYAWINSILDEDAHVNREAFFQGVEQYYASWMERYKGKPYGTGNNLNYNWQWDTFFDTFGL